MLHKYDLARIEMPQILGYLLADSAFRTKKIPYNPIGYNKISFFPICSFQMGYFLLV